MTQNHVLGVKIRIIQIRNPALDFGRYRILRLYVEGACYALQKGRITFLITQVPLSHTSTYALIILADLIHNPYGLSIITESF